MNYDHEANAGIRESLATKDQALALADRKIAEQAARIDEKERLLEAAAECRNGLHRMIHDQAARIEKLEAAIRMWVSQCKILDDGCHCDACESLVAALEQTP